MLTDRKKKIIAGVGIALFLILMAALCLAAGKPILKLVSDPQGFRSWVSESGPWGRLAFVGMMLVQIFVAFIPGEPLEISAGYAFGAWEGTMLCMVGAIAGSALVFLFVRRFGIKAVEVFFPREKINSLRFMKNAARLNMLIFILFLIPGTPKDIMSYCVGLTRMKMGTWLLISGIARIPSIVTSTIGGDALGMGHFGFAAIVFGATMVVAGIGLLIYNRVCRKKNDSLDEAV